MQAMAVIDAFRGSLLTRHFVAHVLASEFAERLGEASAAGVRRRCGRWVRQEQARLGPASGVRAVCDIGARPLLARLGYDLRVESVDPDGQHIIAIVEGARGVALTLVVTRWQERLDQVWRIALRAGLRARQRWCVCFNGRQLRLVDVDRPYARRFLEFDLAPIVEDERAFQLLWALLRPAAFAAFAPSTGSGEGQPPLIDQIVAACDAHGGSVRESLQQGVRRALGSLALALAASAGRPQQHAGADRPRQHAAADRSPQHAVADRSPQHAAAGRSRQRAAEPTATSRTEIVAQALTVIYRLLFLLFAEARMLVPVWHPTYRDSYSIGSLHALAERRLHRGLWPALQAISRLAHDGCVADDLSVTAFNGQLFSPEHTPLGEHARVDDAIIADVLDALMTTPAGHRHGHRGRERITYADLGVEQLGTVYERVLDYAPQLERDIGDQLSTRRGHPPALRPNESTARAPTPTPTPRVRQAVRRSSARRKESGSFYTPRSMADYLVRVTLGPLVAGAAAEDILSLRVLDPSMGSGAFLVSACRFLAQAYEQACEREGRGSAPAEVRRYIARHCLFGVDLNPMAVQLARLSLWLTTMVRDAPLTFLDHHLKVGDSLVGASLDDLVRRPPAFTGERRRRRGRLTAAAADLPLFSGDEQAQLMRAILPARARLTAADDTAATVREKERLLQSLTRDGALSRWLRLADVWCSSWFRHLASTSAAAMDANTDAEAPPAAAWPALVDYLLHDQAVLPRHMLDGWLTASRSTAARRRFFHWTLEFPEVFFDADGQPLATGGFDAIIGNPPWDMLRDDAHDPYDAHDAHEDDGVEDRQKDTAALGRFVRESGVYAETGDAHLNCYQLFVERSLTLLKRGGRFGLVLPWGLAADHGSALLRRRLLESCELDTLVSFENRHAIFPIHRGTRFLLMTGSTARTTRAVRCRFGQRDPTVLDTWNGNGDMHANAPPPAQAPIIMTVDLLRRVSGEGLAFPDVRTTMDIALLERLHRDCPALSAIDGWQAKFGRELNATDDRALFVSAAAASSNAPSRSPQWSQSHALDIPVIDGKHLHPFTVTLRDATLIVDPTHTPHLLTRLPQIAHPRLAYREIASPTNRLTLIAAMLPAHVVSTHTVVCLKSTLPPDAQWCLCALLNSFVANYLIRMRVSTHVSVALLERMPTPKPLRDSPLFQQLARLAEQLSDVGGIDGEIAGEKPNEPYARLQALAAQAYGLDLEEFAYVLSTFPLIDEETTRAALDAFARER